MPPSTFPEIETDELEYESMFIEVKQGGVRTFVNLMHVTHIYFSDTEATLNLVNSQAIKVPRRDDGLYDALLDVVAG